ncbi:hypothetical protein KQX54_008550 [Cotesia glomerata]|uniref:Uncharacterized protein n=1 Tax=Cotesia glomerata TaxID=32391 RepID=A0AAV7IDY2_COTGL|nr:hypothetical protein KQX54_008550 [Cotesia glomerata]
MPGLSGLCQVLVSSNQKLEFRYYVTRWYDYGHSEKFPPRNKVISRLMGDEVRFRHPPCKFLALPTSFDNDDMLFELYIP